MTPPDAKDGDYQLAVVWSKIKMDQEGGLVYPL